MYQNNLDWSEEFCLYRLQEKLKKFIEIKNMKSSISDTLIIENVKHFDSGMVKMHE